MSRQRELQKGKSGQADRSGPTISPSQIGQRVLIIGNSILGFGGLFLGFRRLAGRFLGPGVGFAVCGWFVALGTFLIGFGRRFIRFTTIFSLINARTISNNSCSST